MQAATRRWSAVRPALVLLVVGIAGLSSPLTAQRGARRGEWRSYAGDGGSTKYSTLNQIRHDTIDRLAVRWRWRSPDNVRIGPQNEAFEATPLMVEGVLYTSTSFSQVAAIDARSGETLWLYDPGSYRTGRPPNNGFLHRGVAYWSDGAARRVLYATGDARLISLDASTGRPDTGFGTEGQIDLERGIPRLGIDPILYGNTSPPIVVGDVVVIGSSIHDGIIGPAGPPGDVRGYDVRTGELRWTFHTVPRAGELGNTTWEDDSWDVAGGANVWAPMSADPELGYVYLPVSCPTNNYYGGHRLGDNLFANSIVCLDAASGERVWHFQTVHHDIWDYDLASAPNLVDIVVDGREIPAVAQVTKHGFTFVFDRRDGTPVWPIEERAVPASTVPGERTAPTQPFPTKPPPFERQGVDPEELIAPTPEVRAQAEEILARYTWGPLFTPPSLEGTILLPGIGGGANWGGAAFDPASGLLYVNSVGTLPFLIQLGYRPGPGIYAANVVDILEGPQGYFQLFRPPFATVTAVDLNRGEIAWQLPNDGGSGTIGMSSSLVTASLLFVVNRSVPWLRAFDKATGRLVWTGVLPASGTGAPMTYLLDGRQYLVTAVGAGDETMELVAWSLEGPLPPVPGWLEVATGEVEVSEGEAVSLDVVRGGGSDGAVTVDLVPVAGSATAGLDFDPAPVVVRFAAGQVRREVEIATLDDALPESTEGFRLELRHATQGAALGLVTATEVRVLDDDRGACVENEATLCLRDGRFGVSARFRTAAGAAGQASPVRLTSETGYFTFFDPDNVELIVKILDGCPAARPFYWVFAAGLTNVEVELSVWDSEADELRTYTNRLGSPFAPILDTAAFATCP